MISKHDKCRIPELCRKMVSSLSLALLLTANGGMVKAGNSAEDPFYGWTALNDQTLGQLRGGFMGGNGLRISFGFENVVMINGDLQVHNVLRIPEINLGSGLDRVTLSGLGTASIIQNGPGNMISPAAFQNNISPGLNTLIQNSLDGQSIQNLRMINIEISNFGLLREAAGLHHSVVVR